MKIQTTAQTPVAKTLPAVTMPTVLNPYRTQNTDTVQLGTSAPVAPTPTPSADPEAHKTSHLRLAALAGFALLSIPGIALFSTFSGHMDQAHPQSSISTTATQTTNPVSDFTDEAAVGTYLPTVTSKFGPKADSTVDTNPAETSTVHPVQPIHLTDNYQSVVVPLVNPMPAHHARTPGSWEISYGAAAPPPLVASNQQQPVTYHDSSPFSSQFPYFKIDEPASEGYLMRNFSHTGRWSFGAGALEDHTKMNVLADGLYLGSGYTQVGPAFKATYDFNKHFSAEGLLGVGPMFSNPDYSASPISGLKYVQYQNLTPILPTPYQLTGYGATFLGELDYRPTKWFTIYAAGMVHGDESRPLRSSEGGSENVNTLSLTPVLGIKYTRHDRPIGPQPDLAPTPLQASEDNQPTTQPAPAEANSDPKP